MASSGPADLFEVIKLISRDVERSVRDERALNPIEKIRRHNAAAVMTALRPGIGKEQVECFDGLFRQQITHGIRNFDIQSANIFERECFSAGFCDSAYQFVDAEKVFSRVTLRELAQERAV